MCLRKEKKSCLLESCWSNLSFLLSSFCVLKLWLLTHLSYWEENLLIVPYFRKHSSDHGRLAVAQLSQVLSTPATESLQPERGTPGAVALPKWWLIFFMIWICLRIHRKEFMYEFRIRRWHEFIHKFLYMNNEIWHMLWRCSKLMFRHSYMIPGPLHEFICEIYVVNSSICVRLKV